MESFKENLGSDEENIKLQLKNLDEKSGEKSLAQIRQELWNLIMEIDDVLKGDVEFCSNCGLEMEGNIPENCPHCKKDTETGRTKAEKIEETPKKIFKVKRNKIIQ